MSRYGKFISIIALTIAFFPLFNGFAQGTNKRKHYTRQEAERRAMHSRDSLMQSLNQSDTSVNSLLQRVEQYTTDFNQIRNSLHEGLDTVDIAQQMPAVLRRVNKIDSLINNRKSGTLRYLFVLRDNLDHTQSELQDWQSQISDIGTKLAQNQNDLIKFTRDTLLKNIPSDSILRKTFYRQRVAVRLLWRKTDLLNRPALLKINLLQDKITTAYTKVLDESDQIDSKIKRFAIKAVSGESDYIWNTNIQLNDFKPAWKRTVRLNTFLFNYFISNETLTHFIGFLFFLLFFSWIIFLKVKVLRRTDNKGALVEQANYICQRPVVSALLVGATIIPYFYDHPPVVFLEMVFLAAIILSLALVKKYFPPDKFKFLHALFWLTILYSISNLFIEISNADRYADLILSIASITLGASFLKKVKKAPETHMPYCGLILKIFITMQLSSLLLNVTGRFSLAKVVGVTAVFNLWMLVFLFFVVRIVLQALFLQFEVKKEGDNIFKWIDFDIVRKKFKSTLITLGAILWLFFLFQNLDISDWATDYVTNLLSQPRTVGGSSFTFGGFVIFILVIWLSSMASRVISYLYDVSAQRVTDLSVLKKKNRTSALLIRMGVFSIGFLIAVAASNFPLDKLTIIISAFGVGIGFGLQNIVNNLVSGLILAFEKPIQIGDYIEVNNREGTMKEIGIRSSRILTENGSEVIIPNGDFVSQQVINWTLSNNFRRMEIKVGVAYGSDILKVQTLLNKILTGNTDILQAPEPHALLDCFNDSSIDYRILFWVSDNSKRNAIKSSLMNLVYAAFAEQGIEIPFPQRDLHVFYPEGANEETKAPDEVKDVKKMLKENPPGQDQ